MSRGQDYKGRPVHPNRDVWVVRIADASGELQHAAADADGLLDLLQRRLSNLRESVGNDDVRTLKCMFDLAVRLQGRARLKDAESLYRECLQGRNPKADSAETSVPCWKASPRALKGADMRR